MKVNYSNLISPVRENRPDMVATETAWDYPFHHNKV